MINYYDLFYSRQRNAGKKRESDKKTEEIHKEFNNL